MRGVHVHVHYGTRQQSIKGVLTASFDNEPGSITILIVKQNRYKHRTTRKLKGQGHSSLTPILSKVWSLFVASQQSKAGNLDRSLIYETYIHAKLYSQEVFQLPDLNPAGSHCGSSQYLQECPVSNLMCTFRHNRSFESTSHLYISGTKWYQKYSTLHQGPGFIFENSERSLYSLSIVHARYTDDKLIKHGLRDFLECFRLDFIMI
ncbi:hypothetical protein PNOK_0732900 [Pyrrhoderma noxium]|uniref:Uncharacterized protein n=1 Tax=Pyrrhoderma noxium TaxID=2282107 RepID=A0A286UCL0_9AGAM|nr:hypothetical protein PNOK_0732900 [Pyrrhoderma noxium]